ncbi:hypothetical protein BDZ97DRAFT_1925626 [Flammula alnicola]|nr:hypothetical protein BDZ97DRAFT_1925626 [Flammula alnicola]
MTFACPTFDFAQHAVHRTYVVRRIHFLPTESRVTMARCGRRRPHHPPVPMHPRPRPVPQVPSASPHAAARARTRAWAEACSRRGQLKRLYPEMFGKLDAGVLDALMELAQGSEGETKGVIKEERDIVEDIYEAIMRLHALAIDLPVPAGDDFAELPMHRGRPGRGRANCPESTSTHHVIPGMQEQEQETAPENDSLQNDSMQRELRRSEKIG